MHRRLQVLLLRERQRVCRVEVVNRPTAFAQGDASSDTSLDVAIRFVDSFCHTQAGREIARNSGLKMSTLQILKIAPGTLTSQRASCSMCVVATQVCALHYRCMISTDQHVQYDLLLFLAFAHESFLCEW